MNPRFMYSLAEILVERAGKKQYIYYGKIGREIGVSDPRALAKPLGRLSRECIELGLPAISAIVVKKDNQMPGDGFYNHVARLKGIGDLLPSKWEEFWRNEVAEVFECKSWDLLLGKLDPDHVMRTASDDLDEMVLQEIDLDIESEIVEERGLQKEGSISYYYGKFYERSSQNRRQAIEIHGVSCLVCGFNFEEVYGLRGKGYIEIHHNKPISSLDGKATEFDPKTDLIPLCSNCHRMIHRRHDEVLTIEELKQILDVER